MFFPARLDDAGPICPNCPGCAPERDPIAEILTVR